MGVMCVCVYVVWVLCVCVRVCVCVYGMCVSEWRKDLTREIIHNHTTHKHSRTVKHILIKIKKANKIFINVEGLCGGYVMSS